MLRVRKEHIFYRIEPPHTTTATNKNNNGGGRPGSVLLFLKPTERELPPIIQYQRSGLIHPITAVVAGNNICSVDDIFGAVSSCHAHRTIPTFEKRRRIIAAPFPHVVQRVSPRCTVLEHLRRNAGDQKRAPQYTTNSPTDTWCLVPPSLYTSSIHDF